MKKMQGKISAKLDAWIENFWQHVHHPIEKKEREYYYAHPDYDYKKVLGWHRILNHPRIKKGTCWGVYYDIAESYDVFSDKLEQLGLEKGQIIKTQLYDKNGKPIIETIKKIVDRAEKNVID